MSFPKEKAKGPKAHTMNHQLHPKTTSHSIQQTTFKGPPFQEPGHDPIMHSFVGYKPITN